MNKIEYKDYTDLGFVTGIIPPNTHLFIEDSGGVLWMVDKDNPVNIYYSPDKGENWGLVDTRDDTITMLYYDRDDNERIYAVDGTLADGSASHQFYIRTSDRGIVEGDLAGAGDEMKDIIWDGTRAFAMKFVKGGAGAGTVYIHAKEFNGAFDDSFNTGDVHDAKDLDMRPGVVIGGFDFFLYWHEDDNYVTLYKYEIAANGLTDLVHSAADIKIPINKSQQGIAYDGSNILYFILQDTGDSKYYLYSYEITEDILTKSGEYNVSLMLDRNTASGIKEKAFHLTEYKVYQLHSVLPYQLHLIAEIDSGEAIVGITDNFLITGPTGKMFEFENISQYVIGCIIHRQDMTIPSATFDLLNEYDLVKGMFIIILDTFTTAGSSSLRTIFEGYVDSFKEGRAKIAKLFSPADDLYNIKPSGDYSGRSDQIIVSLIGDYCEYVTAGTLSAGGAMGTLTFYGDKTMFKIINELALFDNFIFALTPEGALDYNDGTIDTQENFTLTSHISNVKKLEGKRAINDVLIKGAIVDGVQVTSDGSHVNQTDIDTNGRNPYERTHSHLNTNALCNTTAANILTRLGTQALITEFSHNDASVGLMQEGETITLEYTGADFSISSDQFGIRESIYDAVFGKTFYRVSDRII